MVNTMATSMVFNFGGIFDSVAVPRLVRTREREGAEKARALARSIFRLSLLLSRGMSLTVSDCRSTARTDLCHGLFSEQERANLAESAWYFLPWTIVCVPYYAAAARHKMEWRFNRVFARKSSLSWCRPAVLVLWHGDIRVLPLAYAVGYGAALVQLAAGSALWRSAGDVDLAVPARRDTQRW